MSGNKHYTTVWANDLGWYVTCDAENCLNDLFPRTNIGRALAIVTANEHEFNHGINRFNKHAEDSNA